MSGRRMYLLGLMLVAVVGAAVVAMVPPAGRSPSLGGLLVGLAVQAPLGWWLVQSVGTPRFISAWVIGMAVRFILLGLMALLVFPALHWSLNPGLLVLGGVLVALLFLEGLVVWLKPSGRAPHAPTTGAR